MTREELHRLVDALPAGREEAAGLLLRFLLMEAAFDPEPLGEEEKADADRAWAEHLTGCDPGEPLENVRADPRGRRGG